jgi:phage-related minor tail protein
VAAKQFAANVKVIEKTYDVLQQQEDSKKSLEIAKQINDYNKRAEALRASIGTETQIRATQHEVEKKQIKERWNFELKGQKATAEQKKALTNLLIALDEKYADDNKSQLKKIIEDWSDSTDSIRSVWTAAMDGMADNLTEFFMTGKAGWEDYANMVVRMIAKIMIQKQIAGIVGSMFSGGQAGQQSTAMTATAFANGGVMTQYGSAQLKKYATGGIANSPQLALYGEGSMPEAYVPLPDGRTIPVTMSGGDQGGASSIQLNIINESGQDVEAESRGQPRFDGERMVLDVVLNAVSKPGKFRSGMKSALSK